MILSNIELIYELFILVFLTYISYKVLLNKVVFIDKYYINIIKYTPIFWAITNYFTNLLSIIIFVLYVVFCVLIFAYTNKNVIILAKKDEYLSFLYDYLESNKLEFHYNRKVYEVSIYLPEYELEIVSNKTIISYFEINLPKSVTDKEESIVKLIKKNSKNKKLNVNNDISYYILIIVVILIIGFHYF